MSKLLWLIAGLSAGAAYVLLTKSQASRPAAPVDELAHKLQDAWADHHTVV